MMNGNLVPKRFIELAGKPKGRFTSLNYLCFRLRYDYISWWPARLEQLMGIRADLTMSARTWVGTFERQQARLLFEWRSRPTALRWDWAVCWRSEESVKTLYENNSSQSRLSQTYFARWLNSVFASLSKRKESIVLWTGVLFEAWTVVGKTVWVCHFREEVLLRETERNYFSLVIHLLRAKLFLRNLQFPIASDRNVVQVLHATFNGHWLAHLNHCGSFFGL